MLTVSRWAEGIPSELLARLSVGRSKPDTPLHTPYMPLFQFCGSTIAGLSLLSPSVMKLVHTQEPEQWLELLLEPGSLYILRYDVTRSPQMRPRVSNSSLLLSQQQKSPPPPLRKSIEMLKGQTSLHPPTQLLSSCRGSARYDFSHEILRDEESFFGEHRVPRGRRISVICRSLPEGMGPERPEEPPPAC